MIDLKLPLSDPGVPDTRSPARLLLWVGRNQLGMLMLGVVFGTLWMVAQSLIPFVVGRGIQEGVVDGDEHQLVLWCGVLLGLGVLQAFSGTMRHRYAVHNWLNASYRLVQVVAHHAARTGTAVQRRLTTGEVVATVSNDAMRAGNAFDVTARLAGAVVSYVVVAVILLSASVVLGLIVLVGVPTLVLLLGGVIRPLQARQREQREQVGQLTALGADTAVGLRVLRGIGGEQAFLARYRKQSEQVRVAGVRVAVPQSTLDAAQVLLPGLFVVGVTWIGARFALTGRLDPGDLVAFYGYAAFLVIPLRTAAEALDKITRALVGARRMLGVLEIDPDVDDPADPVAAPLPGAVLEDASSGVRIEAGVLTCLAAATPEETSEIADRLGRFSGDGPGAALDGVPLDRLALPEVRRRILVSEADPLIFSGALRGSLDPWLSADDASIHRALGIANATDILEALEDGLEEEVDERGRSFSGGQRQRLVLARALIRDPEILILVEPTSAVDAHSEARIARALHDARAGRTTVVVTTSPLVLDAADRVVWFEDGRVAASGSHRELLTGNAGYREAVTRGEAA